MTGVWITYPHANTVTQSFSQSLLNTVIDDLNGGDDPVIREVQAVRCFPGDGLIRGRNQAMKDFLASDAEWLWTLDSDMGFPRDMMRGLLAYEKPVVSGLYNTVIETPGHRWATRPLAEREMPGGYVPYAKYLDGMKVDAVGAGCLLVHRDAAELVREAFGENWWTLMDPYGEDYSFCRRLGKCEIPITLSTKYRLTHQKSVWV